MPLPPWRFREVDPFKEQGILHLPFHSWLRMKNDSAGSNKFLLEEESYAVKKQEGASVKPKTIIPQKQDYRHVDHVSFQTGEIVNAFLSEWRATGEQRCGYLLGQYVKDPYLPLGVRAKVEAIYEPPQKTSLVGVKLLEEKDSEKVDEFAKMFGLERVRTNFKFSPLFACSNFPLFFTWKNIFVQAFFSSFSTFNSKLLKMQIGLIWTAIEVNDKKEVVESRSEEKGYLISGPEYIQAAKMQNQHANPCAQSLTGTFGSKFVSVVITGIAEEEKKEKKGVVPKDKTAHLGLRCFQVSNQCCWLVKDKIIRANKNDFSVLQVRKSNKLHVPRIMYTTTVDDYKGDKQFAPKIQKEADEGEEKFFQFQIFF